MDPNLLVTVLARGEEQTRLLEARLHGPPLDAESCKSLARQVQSSFQTAIAMAKHLGAAAPAVTTVGSDSPQSVGSESPRSDNSDQAAVRDQEQREMMCKKRKSLPKWSSQLSVSVGGGIEGPLDDGYSWRKYGQKDILGAKYPRGYYRCTHRNSQGCLATKQVQRSDHDLSVFDVSYRGVHTCVEKPHKAQASPTKSIQYNPLDSGPAQQNMLMSLRGSLKVKTEGLESDGGQPHVADSSSFSFPSTLMSCVQAQNNMFTVTFPSNSRSANNSESNHFSLPQVQTGNNYAAGQNMHRSESELTEIISAATSATNSPMLDIDFGLGSISANNSESNYFSLSQVQTSNNYAIWQNVHRSEPELTEIISAATSATNSPTLDIDFGLGPGEFDPNFPFDGANFF